MLLRDWGIAGIYMITNTVNGKHYIGKSNNIMRRWTHHCYPSAAKRYKLSYDIQKYGVDKFTVQFLKLFPTQLDYYVGANYYEAYFMSVYEPEYNIAFGSGNSGNTKDFNIADDDFTSNARTLWQKRMAYFRKHYTSLEKYNACHPPSVFVRRWKEYHDTVNCETIC